jgi:4-hydroxybenzoate polyprenyltransferase
VGEEPSGEGGMSGGQQGSGKAPVICVDLDGTLLRSDSLHELLCGRLRNRPWQLAFAPVWLLSGRAALKAKLAEGNGIDPSSLPYNEELLTWLRAERSAGRKIVLATAADRRVADAVAKHLGIFDEVLASDGMTNLKGAAKREALAAKYGAFAYVGNSGADFPVWEGAAERVVTGAGRTTVAAVTARYPGAVVIGKPRRTVLPLIRALRPHQWVKNLLLFVPVIMAHQLSVHGSTGHSKLLQAFTAFCSFSLCASSVYVLNDLLDIEADRMHRTKRRRPFASGELSILLGFALLPFLWAGAIALAALLKPDFIVILGAYLVLTCGYSFWLKQFALIDIIILAGLYTIRIFAGGVAGEVPVSQWLMAFSMFIFFSLACVKRYSELLGLRRANEQQAPGRGYTAGDLEPMAQFGCASAFLSVLVLALYINSGEVTVLYRTPQLLWLICPLLLYWLSRVWLLAHRGVLHEDPIVFAIKDRVSYMTGLLTAAIILGAIRL